MWKWFPFKETSRIFFSSTNHVYHHCSCSLIKTVHTFLVSFILLLVWSQHEYILLITEKCELNLKFSLSSHIMVGPEKTNESVFQVEISATLILCVQIVGKSCSNILPKYWTSLFYKAGRGKKKNNSHFGINSYQNKAENTLNRHNCWKMSLEVKCCVFFNDVVTT